MCKSVGAFAVILASFVLGGSTSGGLSSPASKASGAGGGTWFQVVRAEYLDLGGNDPHRADTVCHVINRSTSSIELTATYVLGPGGINDVIKVSNLTAGVVLPPLAHLRIPINNLAMPGVLPQTSATQSGVSSVVVGWSGSPDALILSSRMERHRTGQQEERAHVEVLGTPLTL